MTRFARAKGSKASNERREEDATPWHVMRQQLDNQPSNDNKVSSEDLSQIKKNVSSNQVGKSNEIWSDFGVVKQTSAKKKNIVKKVKTEYEANQLIGSTVGLDQAKTKKKSKLSKICEGNLVVGETSSVNFENKVKKGTSTGKPTYQGSTEKKNKRLVNANNSDCNVNTNGENKTRNIDRIKDPTISDGNTPNQFESINKSKVVQINKHGNSSGKQNNFSNWKNYNSSSYSIIANGREIKIVRYEGFLIKKGDAKQLKILRKKLKAQNIPLDKIKAIMKLERRKAEKALGREKNTVCFHCRKFGHNFADCPDIKESENSKLGICFKCGSTEHTYFQCKVSQNQNFRFAVCFICKEQGHIARQCSLNPQGQYPKGGSCHLCGEVTHLRKDCPKAVEQKTNKTLTTVDTLQSRQLEDIDDVKLSTKKSEKNKNKLVTF